jgi:dihydrofolate reductase
LSMVFLGRGAGIADKEFQDYSVQLIGSIDTMLFGRVTYELMASYWPSALPETDDPRIIVAMNSFSKIVFSKTLTKVEWKNSRLAKGNPQRRSQSSNPGRAKTW